MPEQLEQSVEQTIQKTTKNLHLIPTNNKLAGILSRLVSIQNTRAMFPLDDGSIVPERVLVAITGQVKDRYDYIRIDCSPHLDQQMLNALVASNRVIIPTQAHFLDTPTLAKTYEMPPDFDPAALKEQLFEQDGYWYRYERMDKTVHHKTETQDTEDMVTLDAPSADLAVVIDKFPVTKAYTKDGYSGDLTLDLQSIKVEVTGYKTVTDSHPHSVAKTYELPYNDRSLMPETVQADRMNLPRTGLTWTKTANVSDSDVPDTWTATVVYSKAIYTSKQVATGYQDSAGFYTLRGEKFPVSRQPEKRTQRSSFIQFSKRIRTRTLR